MLRCCSAVCIFYYQSVIKYLTYHASIALTYYVLILHQEFISKSMECHCGQKSNFEFYRSILKYIVKCLHVHNPIFYPFFTSIVNSPIFVQFSMVQFLSTCNYSL